jgi:25S rRNA (adenine2142-N1)-methyltransferase
MTLEHMRELMNAVGFSQLEERWKPGGKMIYWLYEKRQRPEKSVGEHFGRKKVLRLGRNRNNFHIILDLRS